MIGRAFLINTGQAVKQSHNALDHRKFLLTPVLYKQSLGLFFICKKGVQIFGRYLENLFMKHRIDIIRSAFIGYHLLSLLFQQFQQGTGNGCFSASAFGCGKHDPF